MLSNYTILSNHYIPETTFRNSAYLNGQSRMARWTLLLGTIACAITSIMYVSLTSINYRNINPTTEISVHLTFPFFCQLCFPSSVLSAF